MSHGVLWLQVLAFCETLADAAGLRKHLVLRTRVLRADPILPDSAPSSSPSSGQCYASSQFARPLLRWRVVTETHPSSSIAAAAAGPMPGDAAESSHDNTAVAVAGQQASKQQEWVFDAVASCVGIFSEMQLPQVRCVPVELACGRPRHAPPQTVTSITQVSAGTRMRGQRACCMLEPSISWCTASASIHTELNKSSVYHTHHSSSANVNICGSLQVPGMAEWPGLQLHSHNYRGAEQFRGQQVMVVGASFSGQCNRPAGSVSRGRGIASS